MNEVEDGWYRKFALEGAGYNAKKSNFIDGAVEFSMRKNNKGLNLIVLMDDDAEKDDLICQIEKNSSNNIMMKAFAKVFEITDDSKYHPPQIYKLLKFSNGKNKTFGIKIDYVETQNKTYNCVRRKFEGF
ncbi:MAG: hypothetical protein KJ583_03480 [Nanoarchaeota archaeon]|nr:hypothetical protein [Nanoarchaeota archaeon]MBU1269764.1 hypothetical protein [Nanoarchaeota archaeon]MBU1604356.1 hypothetical protein [Nanoarchaeota archaeon]MBU2443388.1 hypothetical protein [Nanoarchaeota archaeon]